MSSVFRSQNIVFEDGEDRQIQIRNLSVFEELDSADGISMEAVLAERNRLLEEAKRTIAQEKESLEQMRNNATNDIADMHAAWQEEKTQLQQQAYDEGFQVGHEDGRNKALAEMEESIKIANETTVLSELNAKRYLDSQERVVLDLAIQASQRIIGHELDVTEETYLSIVKRAIKEAREMKEVRLYVSNDYFELVSDNRAELASIFPPDVPFLIFANEDFESTQCYIETNHGRIVVSIDEQLAELKERLVEIMESGE